MKAVCTAVLLGLFATNPLVSATALDGWIWSFDPRPTQGQTVSVNVSDAPGFPVTVRLYVGGTLRDSGEITSPDGICVLSVPPDTAGKAYEIKVIGGGQTESSVGTVGG